VKRYLRERGIATMIYYPTPIHLQPLFAAFGYQAGDFPESERAAREVLSLPMYPELTEEQIIRVTNTLKEATRELGIGEGTLRAI